MMVKKTFLTLGLMSVIVSGLVADSFTARTYGGLWDKDGEMASAVSGVYSPALDGPWFREGAFSSPVTWGDPLNKRDVRDMHNTTLGDDDDMWPAVSWGRDISGAPYMDPWGGDGYAETPPKAGASGIGLTGYGYTPPGQIIIVGNTTTMFYMGSFDHVNNPLNFIGSNTMPVGWNVELYRADGTTPIDDPKPKRHYHFLIDQWETFGGGPCPRDGSTDMVTDTIFNAANGIHGGVGLGLEFQVDGVAETTYCSDPFTFRYVPGDGDTLTDIGNGRLRDTFTDDGVNYEIIYSGFYERKALVEGCTVSNDITCFEQKHTLWSLEGRTNTGYVRMQINKLDQGCTPGYWKQPQHLDSWAAAGLDPQASFNTTFGCGPTITLLNALKQGGGGEKALMRHAVAALLNAKSSVDYAISEAAIISKTCIALSGGDVEGTKNEFEAANEGEGGCPLN